MACGHEDRDGEACKNPPPHSCNGLTPIQRRTLEEWETPHQAKKTTFFDELHKILSDKPSTQSKIVINSTTIATASSWEDESENIEIISKGSSCTGDNNNSSSKMLRAKYSFVLLQMTNYIFSP